MICCSFLVWILFMFTQTIYLFETNLNLWANTSTPDVAQYHLQYNLTASCLCCLSTGLTERNNHAILYRYGDVCQQLHQESSLYCTYRWNSVSEVLSDDVRLSICFHFKVLNILQNNLFRIFRFVLFIVSLHARKLA